MERHRKGDIEPDLLPRGTFARNSFRRQVVSKKGVEVPEVIYTSVFILRVGAPDDHATATLSGESILVAHSRCRMINK